MSLPEQRAVRLWNVGQLIEWLKTKDQNLPVKLIDADTYWTIEKFNVTQEDDGVTFWPSDYPEMKS